MVGVWKSVRTIAWMAILMAAAAELSAAQIARPGVRPVKRALVGHATGAGDDDDFMTITLSGGAVNFNFVSGSASNPGSGSITVNFAYTCPCDTPTFEMYAYFNSGTSAMTDGAGDLIPASAFSISDNGGAFRALTGTQPFGGANAGLDVVSIPGSSANGGGGRHTDVLNFNVNLSTGTLPKLPPGTYTGTLTIQAQAQ
jgi:hypothetical protein